MSSRVFVLLAIGLSVLQLAAAPVKGPMTLSVDVPPGKWKSLRLQNLPNGAVVGVGVETSGDLAVAFVNASDYKRFPATTRPLFSGRIESRLSFSVTIPAT